MSEYDTKFLNKIGLDISLEFLQKLKEDYTLEEYIKEYNIYVTLREEISVIDYYKYLKTVVIDYLWSRYSPPEEDEYYCFFPGAVDD